MEVKATAKTLRIQPRKARLVLDLIRGKDVEEAKAICKFTPNKGGYLVWKSFELCHCQCGKQQ